MSVAPISMDVAGTTARDIRTTFTGIVRGELRKIAHMRITWVMAVVITVFTVGGQLLLISGPNNGAQMRNAPLDAFYNLLAGDVAIVRIFSGIFILVLAAHVVGLEYQYGTIRILLARGVGRLHLLGGKIVALALVGFALMLVESLIELAFGWGLTLSLAQGGQPWRVLGDEFWADMRVLLFYLALNLVVSMLLAVAASVVGRSLAFGLAVGLSWFAVDNLLTIPLNLLARFTHSDFWLKLSGALLGPLLNRLPDFIAPPYHVNGVAKSVSGFGPMPLVQVPSGTALLVIGLYTTAFVVTAITLTQRRDVLN